MVSRGSALEAFLGHFPVPLKLQGKSKKKCVLLETVVKFWVFGSSLEGLPRAQNRHPEDADSSSDLLEN